MKKYIGTKVVEAKPMDLGEFIQHSGRNPYANDDSMHDGNEQGYLVKYKDGYESWSPKKVFEEAYRSFDTMDLGDAIKALKQGEKVARKGWNGKDQYVYYVPADRYPAKTENAKKIAGSDGCVGYRAYLALKTVQGDIATWVPSISDTLAEDWEIVK